VNGQFVTNSQHNTNVLGSIKRYLKYSLKINSSFELNSFPVNYEHFSFVSFLNSVKKLSYFDGLKLNNARMYSLHYSEDETSRTYWMILTNKILSDGTINPIIFLYNSGLDGEKNELVTPKTYKTLEATDENFCHSRLMRDFVKKNKIGFEIDLGLKQDGKDMCNVFSDELNNKFSKYLEKNSVGSYHYSKFKEKIVDAFNGYFDKNAASLLDKNCYKKYLTDFYAYNLNCKAFADAENEDEIITGIKINDIITGHELYGSVLKKIKENPCRSNVNKVVKWQIYLDILSDLTKLLVYHCELKKEIKILLIDDKPKNISEEIKFIKEISNQKIIVENDDKNTILTFEKYDELFNALESNDNKVSKEIKEVYDKIITGNYDFIIIDLDYYGELKGFDYLRKLRKAKTIYSKPYVIVFTRNEDPKSVQKALNMGALFVASKQNVAHLLLELYKVLPLVCDSQNEKTDYSLGHNWSLLYQLPLNKILSLKSESERIKGISYQPYEQDKGDYGFDNQKLKTDREWLWINKLPKAELHCHIGSVLGPELIPQTSLLVLAQKYNHKSNNIRHIIEYILPIVIDPFLFEEVDDILEEKLELFNGFKDFVNSEWYKLKSSLIIDTLNQFKHQSVFTIISDSLNLKAFKNKTPEEVLLSPEDETLEKQFIPFGRLKTTDYYKSKKKLRELGIKYDEVILFFILILFIRQEYHINNAELSKSIESLTKIIRDIFNKGKNKKFKFPETDLKYFGDNLVNQIDRTKLNYKLKFYQAPKRKKILEFLISAHSHRRCLDFHNRGLFDYLRGCEYGGAPHLQSKESIFLVAHHIIYNYVIPDNIRYLDLRCAIDGYNKFNLFNQPDDNKKIPVSKLIVDSLKESFTYWQSKAFEEINFKTHVNLIITAKRHKSIKEFEENILITVENYKYSNDKDINEIKSFFDTRTEIVSFDIAGLEKGNRVSRFKDKLGPLLEKCIPITMHAGEEDSHEAIWEAYYLAHAQRIGHALTLKDNEKLINSIRESLVNIELCPISNYLTNNNYSFNLSSSKNKYPLKDYLTKRISVSINTDNPYVSDSNLTKEFLFAAKISGGLTRWEILKILLYSFKSITIHKSLKTKLLKEINEEIYEILLNEGE
jgi:adenosine deaminase/DNA-binding NarL/FixJ family response regulator